MKLGQGWSRANERKTSALCIEFAREVKATQTEEARLRVVEDRYSAFNAYGITAEAAFDAIFAEGAARTELVKSTKLDASSLLVVADVSVRNFPEFVAPEPEVALKRDYVELARTNPSGFERACGDSYVSAIYSGASIAATFALEMASRDEHQQLTSRVEAIGTVAEFNADFVKNLHRYEERKHTTIRFRRFGGWGEPLPMDKQSLYKSVEDLGTVATTAPYPILIAVQSYSVLRDAPLLGDDARKALREAISIQYWQRVSLRAIFDDILENPSRYHLIGDSSKAKLAQLQDELQAEIDALRSAARRCEHTGECTLPALSSDDYQYREFLPVPKGSFPEELELAHLGAVERAAALKVAEAQSEIHAIARGERGVPTFQRSDIMRDLDTNLVKPLAAARAEAQRHLDEFWASGWRVGLLEARLERWIRSAKRARCRWGEPGCITNEQVDHYRREIYVRNGMQAK